MKKTKVLFVFYLDKFTEGLTRFFQNSFLDEIDSKFVFYGKKHQFDFEIDKADAVYIDSYKDVSKNSVCYEWAGKSDMIIFSGIFGSDKLFLRFPKGSVDKSYLQFWGGDFYNMTKIKGLSLKNRVSVLMKKHYIRKARGVIMLVPDDYKQLCEVVRPEGMHFVAPVCGDGSVFVLLESLKDNDKAKSPVKILLGNSATESNQHIAAMDILKKYKDEDIAIVCPLSYGDENYRDRVIEYGNNLFGKKFVPVTSYMSREEYYGMISECTAAIFNNDRQQAIGNINAALALGCKVFIRRDTSMWGMFHDDRKMAIYSIDDINDLNFDDFIMMEPNNNYDIYRCYSDKSKNVEAWSVVLNSVKE